VRSLTAAIPYVLFHHERWDGTGYPTSRSGTDIPIEGRILSIADALDAMISDRPYRAALAWGEAIETIGRCAGGQFDPELAAVFLDAVEAGDVAPHIQLTVAAV
jgi:HD-GYP domain-containing protein (c-di-GMP phosphodiesterase class II)